MLKLIMSFLTNIKYQYNLRILQDFISSNNYTGFFDHLENLRNNKKLYIQLLLTLGNQAILDNKEEIFRSKIIWINSFMQEDLNYISLFLDFYYKNIKDDFSTIHQYEDKLIKILKNISNLEKLNFSDFVERSYLYQYLILHEDKEPIKYVKNNLPFFSTPSNLNFTKNTLTNSFIYIIDDPYIVYQKIKNNSDSNKNIAQNIFLNLDNQSSSLIINNVDIETNKQGWHTHALSWTNPNVMNSLNGKVILKKDLADDTFEVLCSIILHFIQSGTSIKMDYNIIKNFIDQHPPSKDPIDINLSQKEKKFLDQYIKNIISKFNFDR